MSCEALELNVVVAFNSGVSSILARLCISFTLGLSITQTIARAKQIVPRLNSSCRVMALLRGGRPRQGCQHEAGLRYCSGSIRSGLRTVNVHSV
ncbi:hypothetical protein KP509_24G004100 [Ceratopteris richardii]|uniref:Uncharacterized protein n=1 Tax=Ceratopteris richardii TaxID=49495 RepID=A0A8T2RS55_CERRI|nr:hypothetical protein KP509_24G004100 [Ceratopteris richardii]